MADEAINTVFEQAPAMEGGETMASNGDVPLVPLNAAGESSGEASSGDASAPEQGIVRRQTNGSLIERILPGRLRDIINSERFGAHKREVLGPSFHDIVKQAVEDRREKREQKPQLPGYPEMAIFLGSEESLMMCRRFATLQARLVLEKQDELKELEDRLYERDLDDAGDYDFKRRDGPVPSLLATRRRGNQAARVARQELIDRTAKAFKEYSELVLAVHEMMALEKPAKHERENVAQFVTGRKPLKASELDWILLKEHDIVTLRGPRINGALGVNLERLINMWKDFRNHRKEKRKKKTEEKTSGVKEWVRSNRASGKWVNYSVTALLIILVPIMFVVPVYVLSVMGQNTKSSIGVLIAFALLFAFLLAAGTPARPHEVLNGSAAYLAVLVVFFGSVTPRSANS